MIKNLNIDDKTAKKLVIEKKLKDSLKAHKRIQIINFMVDSVSQSHSKYLI